MAPLDMKPNELESYWLPFTPNRAFKKRPRLFSGAKDMHFFTPDGRKVIDATSGLFCVNAGHTREPIVKAIQHAAATLDFAPPFQYAHPKVFELSSRLALLAPGDLDYCLFANSGSEAVDTALKVALAYHKARGDGARTRFIGRERGYHASASAAFLSAAWSTTERRSATCWSASTICRRLTTAPSRPSRSASPSGAPTLPTNSTS